MQEILAQQRNAAKPVSGKDFLLGVIGVVVKLALAQILVNLLIMLTGIGLLNIAFYLYAIYAIVSFMGKTVAGSLYMLKEDTLYLQKTLGDSTTSVVEIPLENVLGVREVLHGERLESSYRRVSVIDAALTSPFRMRLAFGLSLISAGLARKVAGKNAQRVRGMVIAYQEEGRRCACVFKPDEDFCAALQAALPDVYGADERTQGNTPVTLMAQALERAFPQLNGHVTPLIAPERVQQAKEEIERQKQARAAKKHTDRKPGGETHKSEEAEETDEVQDDTL